MSLTAFTSGAGKWKSGPVTSEEIIRRQVFEETFGERPLVTHSAGGKVDIRLYTARNRYDSVLDDFVGFAESDLEQREQDRLVESTGGRPVFWLSKAGTIYLAILGVPWVQYRIPASIFSNPNIGDPVSIVWTSILQADGVLDLPADVPGSTDAWDRIGPSIRAKNEENKKKLGL